MGESKRNILDKENGFNTRVNLFIIRYMYYHMKKASVFMMAGTGKRQKSKDLEIYTSISRHRFGRMFRGYAFELTQKETTTITERFNIGSEYFKKNGELIPLYGITQDDWKCYFYMLYGEDVSVSSLKKTDTEKVAGKDKVEAYLDELVKKKFIIKNYDTSSPVYRIYYFFENGATYRDISTLDKLRENLETLKITDWWQLEDKPEQMKKYLELLEKHYEYVKAYLKCHELENK